MRAQGGCLFHLSHGVTVEGICLWHVTRLFRMSAVLPSDLVSQVTSN